MAILTSTGGVEEGFAPFFHDMINTSATTDTATSATFMASRRTELAEGKTGERILKGVECKKIVPAATKHKFFTHAYAFGDEAAPVFNLQH